MPRERKLGQVMERKEFQKGYITTNNTLRLRVETDCLTLEEAVDIIIDTDVKAEESRR